MSTSPYFIPPYREFTVPDDRSECEQIGEHQGDPHYQPDVLGTMWERWSCCDEETPLKDPNE